MLWLTKALKKDPSKVLLLRKLSETSFRSASDEQSQKATPWHKSYGTLTEYLEKDV